MQNTKEKVMSRVHQRTTSKTCALESLESRQLLSAGALDTSFNTTGTATIDFGAGIAVSASDVAVQPDGKTVVVGHSSTGDIALARFNIDGTLDTTFGANHNGRVLTHVGRASRPCTGDAIAIDSNGSIVVAGRGQFDKPAPAGQIVNYSMVLMRFNADGTLPKFNYLEATKFGALFYTKASDVAIQSDRKIVVVGEVLDGNDGDLFAARFNLNLAPDTSFAGSGHKAIDFSGTDDIGSAVAIDYSGTKATNPRFGSIVVVGQRDNKSNDQILVARLKPNGDFDKTFARSGKYQWVIPANCTPGGVLVQSGGEIVVAGTAQFSSPTLDNKFILTRLLPNGTPDTSFGGTDKGWSTTDLLGDDRASDVIESFDGGLLVGGSTQGKFAVVQYSADGVIDSSFGDNGRTVTGFSDAAAVTRMAQGPGRRFVAVDGAQFHTARYLQNGANIVTIGTFNVNASEQGTKQVGLIVGRTERLPIATRVYFSIGGTATAPSIRKGGTPADYTLEGMTLPLSKLIRTKPFVDIPANQSFVNVVLHPIDDAALEPTETAKFTVLPDAAYDLGNPSIQFVIADNDSLMVNFQTAAATTPAGAVADVGLAFGNRGGGLSYGWDADNTVNARLRTNPRVADKRYNTFNHLQKNGANRIWEIGVPNGLYEVTVAAGDPDSFASVYKLNLEKTLAVSGTPSGATFGFRRTIRVKVSDGRLSLTNAAGASNNKVAWIEIKAAAPGTAAGEVTGKISVRLTPLVIPGDPTGGGIIGGGVVKTSRIFSVINI
jgi:uncharacterized delta-60 repeat protein